MSRKIIVSINSTWNFINFRSGLLRALQADGFTVIAAAPDDGYVSNLEQMGIRFAPLSMNRRGTSVLGDSRLLLEYVRLLRQERPAALLSFTIKPNIYGSIAARLCGVPAIANVAGLGTMFLRGGLLNRLIRQMYTIAMRRSQVTFFQNSTDRDLFVSSDIVRNDRARLLPGSGVDLARFAHSSKRPPPRGASDFLLVARLLWAKGIWEFERAARRLLAEGINARFRILGMTETGEGAVDEATVERWSREGLIDYLGATDDVRPFLAAADCVVLPSFYPEGTPRSLLEAAASGRPIITTDLPGCRDVIKEGKNGFCIAPRDSNALLNAMRAFANLDPEAKAAMGRSSRALAERRFDEAIVVSAYREALRDVIGSGNHP